MRIFVWPSLSLFLLIILPEYFGFAIPMNQFVEIGEGFWNLRGSFTVLGGLFDVGTQMSLCRLGTGKFLVIDTCKVTPNVKKQIDDLTQNGELIDGVIATHPFHTVYFRDFHSFYPLAKYYGTPRHIRTIQDIAWAGDVSTTEILEKWEPDISMRIPAGAEFNDPAPNNHFSGVFVLHRPSRTIHIDDTLMYFENPGFLVRKLFSIKAREISFHPTLTSIGLYPTPEAPGLFKGWIEQLLNEWDFENICTAHNANKRGGAKQELANALTRNSPILEKLAEKNLKRSKC